MAQLKPVPEGMHTLTPQLTIEGCAQAIQWYQQAFGAELLNQSPDPSGTKIWHAEMRIGDSILYLNDAFPEAGGPAHPGSLWVYADHIDELWDRAVKAGGRVVMPLADMFWGDRTGTVVDPFGNRWNLAQRIKNLTPDEMKRAQEEFVASLPKK
jgi:PhnB protein